MKICWDNLEKLIYTKNGNFKCNGVGATYYEKECLNCSDPFLGQSINLYCDDHCTKTSAVYLQKKSKAISGKPGRRLSNESRNKISKANSGPNSGVWKGGYCINGIPTYDLYAHQLEPIEQYKRNIDDPNILEVKCTYCGRWYVPNLNSVRHRIQGINSNDVKRFYCSKECKQECPIFGKQKHYKNNNTREVQPQLRQMVFERDNYICQKCSKTSSLHCHHINPVASNPIESADVDNCITLCKECHKEVHKQSNCKYDEIRTCK